MLNLNTKTRPWGEKKARKREGLFERHRKSCTLSVKWSYPCRDGKSHVSIWLVGVPTTKEGRAPRLRGVFLAHYSGTAGISTVETGVVYAR